MTSTVIRPYAERWVEKDLSASRLAATSFLLVLSACAFCSWLAPVILSRSLSGRHRLEGYAKQEAGAKQDLHVWQYTLPS